MSDLLRGQMIGAADYSQRPTAADHHMVARRQG